MSRYVWIPFCALLGMSACAPAQPDYCVRNQIGLQPLVTGSEWVAEWGVLDEAHSHCLEVTPPEIRWQSSDPLVLEINEAHGLRALRPGSFAARAVSPDGTPILRVDGFVVPEQYQLTVPDNLILHLGESLVLDAIPVDATGVVLEDSWLFARPLDAGIVAVSGCLPRKPGGHCTLTAVAEGQVRLRVAVGSVVEIVPVQVNAADAS